MKFECHITCSKADADKVRTVCDLSGEAGWKFSQIDGDPVMGIGSRCYMTRYGTDYRDVFDRMTLASSVLMQAGILVLRQKIEMIMFDSLMGGNQ